jgi:hypothetical protein
MGLPGVQGRAQRGQRPTACHDGLGAGREGEVRHLCSRTWATHGPCVVLGDGIGVRLQPLRGADPGLVPVRGGLVQVDLARHQLVHRADVLRPLGHRGLAGHQRRILCCVDLLAPSQLIFRGSGDGRLLRRAGCGWGGGPSGRNTFHRRGGCPPSMSSPAEDERAQRDPHAKEQNSVTRLPWLGIGMSHRNPPRPRRRSTQPVLTAIRDRDQSSGARQPTVGRGAS